MVTMVDEIYDRHYREGRAELNASIDRAFRQFGTAVSNAFNVLDSNADGVLSRSEALPVLSR